jgi:hypothetical protein
MSQDICQLQISVNDIMLVKMMEPMNKLTHNFNSLVLHKISFLLYIGIKIPIIAVLKDKIVVVIGFFHIVKLDDIGTFATFQNFDFTLKKFFKFS